MLTILFSQAYFFLIIDLHFCIHAVVIQFFNPAKELTIPIGQPTKEQKAQMETHPVNKQANISKC